MIYLAIYLIGVVAAFLLIAIVNDKELDNDDKMPIGMALLSYLTIFLYSIYIFLTNSGPIIKLIDYKPSFKKLFKRKKQ